MSNKDNLLNAGKKRALPPKTRNIPEATDLPLSEELPKEKLVDTSINIKEEKKAPIKEQAKPKTETKPKVEEHTSPVQETQAVVEPKRGPGKPKKRKPGDRKISFYIDEDLVPGLFNNLGYGDSAGEMINIALREYQKNHNII